MKIINLQAPNYLLFPLLSLSVDLLSLLVFPDDDPLDFGAATVDLGWTDPEEGVLPELLTVPDDLREGDSVRGAWLL